MSKGKSKDSQSDMTKGKARDSQSDTSKIKSKETQTDTSKAKSKESQPSADLNSKQNVSLNQNSTVAANVKYFSSRDVTSTSSGFPSKTSSFPSRTSSFPTRKTNKQKRYADEDIGVRRSSSNPKIIARRAYMCVKHKRGTPIIEERAVGNNEFEVEQPAVAKTLKADSKKAENEEKNKKIDEGSNIIQSKRVDDDDVEEAVAKSPDGRFLKFNQEVGRGSFKTVYRGLDSDTGVDVAWCELMERKLNKSERLRFREEAEMLKGLQHPNIVQFFDYWEMSLQKRHCIVLVTELMPSGTLKQYLKRLRKVSVKILKRWCQQILKGLAFLHSRKPPIIHRDLKCDNIFITGTMGVVKIGDLGLATLKNRSAVKSVIGTPEFMAPEVYEEHYDEGVDVYAFGMCMVEIATLEYPYGECSGPAQIYRKVTAGIRPLSFEKIEDKELKYVVDWCTRVNNDERPTAQTLLDHEFFQEDTGIKVELVNREETIQSDDDTIIFRLQVTDPIKRKDKHKENEAIEFDFDTKTESPEKFAAGMAEMAMITKEDEDAVSRMMTSIIATLKKDRDERRKKELQKEIEEKEKNANQHFQDASQLHSQLSGSQYQIPNYQQPPQNVNQIDNQMLASSQVIGHQNNQYASQQNLIGQALESASQQPPVSNANISNTSLQQAVLHPGVISQPGAQAQQLIVHHPQVPQSLQQTNVPGSSLSSNQHSQSQSHALPVQFHQLSAQQQAVIMQQHIHNQQLQQQYIQQQQQHQHLQQQHQHTQQQHPQQHHQLQQQLPQQQQIQQIQQQQQMQQQQQIQQIQQQQVPQQQIQQQQLPQQQIQQQQLPQQQIQQKQLPQQQQQQQLPQQQQQLPQQPQQQQHIQQIQQQQFQQQQQLHQQQQLQQQQQQLQQQQLQQQQQYQQLQMQQQHNPILTINSPSQQQIAGIQQGNALMQQPSSSNIPHSNQYDANSQNIIQESLIGNVQNRNIPIRIVDENNIPQQSSFVHMPTMQGNNNMINSQQQEFKPDHEVVQNINRTPVEIQTSIGSTQAVNNMQLTHSSGVQINHQQPFLSQNIQTDINHPQYSRTQNHTMQISQENLNLDSHNVNKYDLVNSQSSVVPEVDRELYIVEAGEKYCPQQISPEKSDRLEFKQTSFQEKAASFVNKDASSTAITSQTKRDYDIMHQSISQEVIKESIHNQDELCKQNSKIVSCEQEEEGSQNAKIDIKHSLGQKNVDPVTNDPLLQSDMSAEYKQISANQCLNEKLEPGRNQSVVVAKENVPSKANLEKSNENISIGQTLQKSNSANLSDLSKFQGQNAQEQRHFGAQRSVDSGVAEESLTPLDITASEHSQLPHQLPTLEQKKEDIKNANLCKDNYSDQTKQIRAHSNLGQLEKQAKDQVNYQEQQYKEETRTQNQNSTQTIIVTNIDAEKENRHTQDNTKANSELESKPDFCEDHSLSSSKTSQSIIDSQKIKITPQGTTFTAHPSPPLVNNSSDLGAQSTWPPSYSKQTTSITSFQYSDNMGNENKSKENIMKEVDVSRNKENGQSANNNSAKENGAENVNSSIKGTENVGDMHSDQPSKKNEILSHVVNDGGASESECSEHPADTGSTPKHQHERKKRKRKTLDKFPKFAVLQVKDTIVECQLEAANQKTVTFQFDINNDLPEEVTNNLIASSLLNKIHCDVFTKVILDITSKVRGDPNSIPVVSFPELCSTHRSPSRTRKTLPVGPETDVNESSSNKSTVHESDKSELRNIVLNIMGEDKSADVDKQTELKESTAWEGSTLNSMLSYESVVSSASNAASPPYSQSESGTTTPQTYTPENTVVTESSRITSPTMNDHFNSISMSMSSDTIFKRLQELPPTVTEQNYQMFTSQTYPPVSHIQSKIYQNLPTAIDLSQCLDLKLNSKNVVNPQDEFNYEKDSSDQPIAPCDLNSVSVKSPIQPDFDTFPIPFKDLANEIDLHAVVTSPGFKFQHATGESFEELKAKLANIVRYTKIVGQPVSVSGIHTIASDNEDLKRTAEVLKSLEMHSHPEFPLPQSYCDGLNQLLNMESFPSQLNTAATPSDSDSAIPHAPLEFVNDASHQNVAFEGSADPDSIIPLASNRLEYPGGQLSLYQNSTGVSYVYSAVNSQAPQAASVQPTPSNSSNISHEKVKSRFQVTKVKEDSGSKDSTQNTALAVTETSSSSTDHQKGAKSSVLKGRFSITKIKEKDNKDANRSHEVIHRDFQQTPEYDCEILDDEEESFQLLKIRQEQELAELRYRHILEQERLRACQLQKKNLRLQIKNQMANVHTLPLSKNTPDAIYSPLPVHSDIKQDVSTLPNLQSNVVQETSSDTKIIRSNSEDIVIYSQFEDFK